MGCNHLHSFDLGFDGLLAAWLEHVPSRRTQLRLSAAGTKLLQPLARRVSARTERSRGAAAQPCGALEWYRQSGRLQV